MLFEYFKHIEFAYPWAFAAAILLPVLLFWYIKKPGAAFVKVSGLNGPLTGSWKTMFRHFPFVLRLLSIAALITALAYPRTQNQEQLAEGEGIDIVICTDVSGSMAAQDLKPNRIESAKKVMAEFIRNRLTDRIGIVLFAGESFTLCPVTTDKNVLLNAVEQIRIGFLDDGTAIGDGLGTSVDRLKESKAKSRIVILLTDGENNAGKIGPDYAKEIAKAFEVKVYTIGVGSDGYVETPESTPLGIVYRKLRFTLNESLLKEIAVESGGTYFRARDNEGLESIYAEIDQLEKSKVEISTRTLYTDKFFPFLLLAALCLLMEWILRLTVFRKFP